MTDQPSSRQIRAARALLNWSRADLAKRTDLTELTIHRIENDLGKPEQRTQMKLYNVLHENGIEFLDNSGVRFKPQGMETFEGHEGFVRFFKTIHGHIQHHGGDICVSGVDEKLFVKYQGKFANVHMEYMAELAKKRSDLKMRILVAEGDHNFVASQYASYRWQPKEYFSPTPFYAFGECLALISFSCDPAPHVILIKSATFAEAYRHSFNMAWVNAKVPSVIRKKSK